MTTVGAYFRLARAGWIMVREGVVAALPGDQLTGPPRTAWRVARLLARRHSADRDRSERFAKAATRLGPSYVKLGQFLATRPDVVGTEIALDLANLQDRMEKFPQAQSVAAVQAIAPTLGIRLRAPLVRSAAGGLTDALAAGGGMPDAVYLPAADATLRPFAEALAGQGIQLIGSAQWAALDLEDERAFRDAWFAAPDPLRFAPFRDAFAEAAGQAGGIIAGLAYDGPDLLRVLAQRGAQTRAGLLSEEGFSGVLGPYRFLPSGQCQRGLAVLKVGAGDFSLIGATSV